jgi:hypothetical protein
MDPKSLEEIVQLSELNGVLMERNRILSILVQYKDAGWLDDSLAMLLTDDICIDQ